MNSRISLIVLMFVFFSCNKKQADCFQNQTASVQLYVNPGSYYSNQYPELPAHHFVNGAISNIGHYSVEDIFIMSNKKYFINGIEQTDLLNPSYIVGTNKLTFTADCNSKNQDLEPSDCDCPPGLKSASYDFTIIDTARIWVKRITYWKQFDGPFGFYPDIYLKLNNFDIKSPVTANYNAAVDGNIVWNIDDTLTISASNFNLSVTAWDYDQVSADEKKEEYFIYANEVNNWATGSQNYYKNGGFIFEIVKL